jgi:hypothetical protein
MTRRAKRRLTLKPPSGGIGLERLALVSVLETESLRWLCRARVSKVVDLARHLRVCLACLEGLRRLAIELRPQLQTRISALGVNVGR